MPDDYGNFKGITVNGDAWERIFGKPEPELLTTPEVKGRYHKLCEESFDANGGCPWGYPFACPISDCPVNRDNPGSDR